MSKIRVGHFGHNGHTLLGALKDHERAELVATCHVSREVLGRHWGEDHPGLDRVAQCQDLDDLIEKSELIVFCSPLRHEQPQQSLEALQAGRHVLAEKPCAFRQEDVDALLARNREGSARFREMGGTTLAPAFARMRQLVAAGEVGEVICMQALKSYPMHEGRPRQEPIDGGLLMQAGIHGVRAMQEVSGLTITEVISVETRAGSGAHGDLRMAASSLCRCDGGAIGNLTVNYLNPPKIGFWGNDQLRLFGTKGLIEVTDGQSRLRICTHGGPFEDLAPAAKSPPYLDLFLAHILDGEQMPLPLERELQSTRVVIAMKEAAETGRAVQVPVR